MKIILAIYLSLVASVAAAGQNVVIVLDDSASMQARVGSGLTRMEVVKRSLVNVVKGLPDDTKIGIVLLNGQWDADKWHVPMTLVGVSRQNIIDNIEKVQPLGGTPLGGAMKAGADGLISLRNKERYGTYRMLIVTDGEAQDKHLVDGYLPEIQANGIGVDTIGVDIPGGHTLATKVNNYSDAADESALVKAIEATFAETSGNDSHNDFELLEGLPDNFASSAIVALSDIGNDPISIKPKTPYHQYTKMEVVGNTMKPLPVNDGMSMGFKFFIGLVVVFIFFLICASVFNH